MRLIEAMQRKGYILKNNAVVFEEHIPDVTDIWTENAFWYYFHANAGNNDPMVYLFLEVDSVYDSGWVEELIEEYGSLDDAVHREI